MNRPQFTYISNLKSINDYHSKVTWSLTFGRTFFLSVIITDGREIEPQASWAWKTFIIFGPAIFSLGIQSKEIIRNGEKIYV